MKANFERANRPLLAHEGGKVDNPRDNGGRTAYGVTQRTYSSWLKKKGLPDEDVFDITKERVLQIYKEQYWDPIKGDQLPAGIDYCVYDAAINSGPPQAAKWLQRAMGVQPDGFIGVQTLELLKEIDSKDEEAKIIDKMCDLRLNMLRAHEDWDVFGKGWSRRVAEVRRTAKAWVRKEAVEPAPLPVEASAPASPVDVKVSNTKEGADATKQITFGGAGLLAWVSAQLDAVSGFIAQMSSLPQWLVEYLLKGLIGIIFLGIIAFGIYTIVQLLRKKKLGEILELN